MDKANLSAYIDYFVSNPSDLELYHFESRARSSVSLLENL